MTVNDLMAGNWVVLRFSDNIILRMELIIDIDYKNDMIKFISFHSDCPNLLLESECSINAYNLWLQANICQEMY